MLLFFEGFQAQNVLIFFLSLMKPSYLSTAKIIPYVDNPLSLRDIGEIEYFNTTYEEYKVIPDGISDYIAKDDFKWCSVHSFVSKSSKKI